MSGHLSKNNQTMAYSLEGTWTYLKAFIQDKLCHVPDHTMPFHIYMPVPSSMQITWPWPPVGRLCHDLISHMHASTIIHQLCAINNNQVFYIKFVPHLIIHSNILVPWCKISTRHEPWWFQQLFSKVKLIYYSRFIRTSGATKYFK